MRQLECLKNWTEHIAASRLDMKHTPVMVKYSGIATKVY